MYMQSAGEYAYNEFGYNDSSRITTLMLRSRQNSYLLCAFECG